ncbi:hypothetical protein ACI6QG_15690 [Roseococcus sp. DSY-14]|uniref:hypothetical protein n=1 Tax=Roseococcus sp. DSY-14 TaxID=3369650 RepID=UPI00387AFD2F
MIADGPELVPGCDDRNSRTPWALIQVTAKRSPGRSASVSTNTARSVPGAIVVVNEAIGSSSRQS